MPRYKTHLAFGFFSYLVFIYLSFILVHFCPTFLQIIGCFLCSILGSIFPDIDTTSKMQRLFFIFSSLVIFGSIVFRLWFLFFNLSFITVFVTLLKHRTITHNAWVLLGLSVLPILLGFLCCGNLVFDIFLGAFCFLIGAFSHILLDFLF